MATLEELERKKAEIEAKMASIRQPIDEHNRNLGWWEYLTGNSIRLGEYQPVAQQMALGSVPTGVGDHPEYYDLSKQLYDLNQQIGDTQSRNRKVEVAESRANALGGTGLQKKTTSTPVDELQIPKRFADVGDNFRKGLRPSQSLETTNVAPTTTSATSSTATTTSTSPKTEDPKKEKPAKVIPTYKQVENVPMVEQVGNQQPLTFGTDFYAVPSNGFTSPNENYAAPITLNPVTFQTDNGGLTHAAMNVLYQNTPATFGQMLSFGNIMQGKRGLTGGINALTQTMQDIDKMNAYAAQGQVAERVQDLMSQGYDMNEARYLALTEYGLQNGYNRMAIGATMPEYAKYADARAKREMDTIAAMGGNYQSQGAFGYTPLGVQNFGSTGDGYFDATINGQQVTGIPAEYFLNGVYSTVKGGDGSGTSNSATRWANTADKRWQMEKAISDAETIADAVGIPGGNGRGLSLEERRARHEQDLEYYKKKQELKNGGKGGNTTGGSVSSAFVF